MKRNYYWVGREWPYRDVKPRIIAEQYVENVVGDDLLDYKMMCFNGQVRCSFVCTERHRKDGVKVTFFDRDWERMPFSRHYPTSDVRVAKPEQYEKMILLAEQLSEGMAFLRVDFYEVGRHIYFGELTFFPGSGFEEFTPVEWDYTLGSWITLPVKEA